MTGGYHAGLNCGLNCAESINFGSEKFLQWFNKFETCQCPFGESENSPNQAVAALKPLVDANERVSILKLQTNLIVEYFFILIDLFSLKFICIDCGKSFGLEKNLKSHQRIQHAIKRPTYVCPKGCGKTCTTPYNLRIHVSDIHGENMEIEFLKGCNEPMATKRKLK